MLVVSCSLGSFVVSALRTLRLLRRRLAGLGLQGTWIVGSVRPSWCCLLCVLALLVEMQGPAYGLLTLNASLSASETYTDNLFFSDGNEEDDFGTFVSPSLTLTYQHPDIIISGTYSGVAQFFVNNSGANRYAQFSNFNIDLPFLTKRIENLEVQLIESFNFSPQLQAFSFAGEPGEETALASLQQGSQIGGLSGTGGAGLSGLGGGVGGLGGGSGIGGIGGLSGIGGIAGGPSLSNQGVFTRRSDAFQNLAGVNLRYLWSARFSTSVGYRNRLTLFTSNAFQDTMIHAMNVGMDYALAPTTSVRTTYGVSISDFIGGQASTSSAQNGGSFTTHSGTIGLNHRFSPTLTSSAQVGVAVTNSRMNFIANASLAKQFQRTTLSAGYRQNVTSGGGLAASATLTQAFVGTLSHTVTNRLSGFVQGGVSRSESLSGSVIDVMAYQARAGLRYLILSWLSGSASYSYIFQDASGTAGNDAQVNQVFVTLTAFAPTWRIIE